MWRWTRFAERLREDLAQAWSMAKQSARLAVGVPDYDVYVAHVRERHPDTVPMTREAFAIARMEAHYRRGTSRCC